MARTRTIPRIEADIRLAEQAVLKAKEKYERAIAELEELMDQKEQIQNQELIACFRKNGKSYEAVKRYLNDSSRT